MAIVINSTTGEIDLDQTTPGTYVVTYTVQGVSSTQEVTVNAVDDATFSYPANSYSQADADPTPTITGLTGGTFSGTTGLVFVDSGTNTGSSTGEIDLSASTIASHTITYSTSSSGSSVCPNTSTFSLAVTAAFSPFQMRFEVASGASKTITIPKTVGSSYTVDWGDGAITTESGSVNGTNISHTYNDGTNSYVNNPTVSIGAAGDTGPFTMFKFNNGGSKSDLLDVPQWGDIVFDELTQMFQGCNNTSFQISATDAPTISNTGNLRMSYAFYGATYFNSDINHWDVSNITGSGRDMFAQASNFNQNLSSWVINTQTINYMFLGTSMSADNYTDTVVGWAVAVYKNSGTYGVDFSSSYRTFTGTKTSDTASGQTYAAKYGSDWPSNPAGENWTNAQDAKNYLTTTAGWSIN